MAIIIPSKNIYDLKNDKIIKNKIKSGEIGTFITTEKKTPTNIYQETFDLSEFNSNFPSIEQDYATSYPNYANFIREIQTTHRSGSAAGIAAIVFALPIIKTIHFSIPYKYGESFINKDRINIQINKTVRKIYTSFSGKFYRTTNWATLDTISIDYGHLRLPEFLTGFNSVDEVINNATIPTSATSFASYSDNVTTVEAKLDFGLIEPTYIIPTNLTPTSNYEFDIDIYCGVTYFTAEGTYGHLGVSDPNAEPINVERGYITEYRPQSVTVNFENNVFSLTLADNDIVIDGENSDGISFSISNNSLLQETYIEEIQSRFKKTVDEYKNGKETATMTCSISNYNDENGAEQISIERNDERKMSFKLYDEVVPCVMNEYGEDSPMSVNADGLPKSFLVLGSEMFYDGSVMQRLSLQENRALDIIISDGTRGLSYSLSDSGTYWICDGIGTATANNIKVSNTVNGKVVREIGDNAFLAQNIKSVYLPNTISHIGNSAFEGCASITKLLIPNSVESMGKTIAKFCDKITEISLPFVNGNTPYLGSLFSEASDTSANSEVPSTLKTVTVHGGEIGESAFENCANISQINIGENVTALKKRAFASISNRPNIYLSPNSSLTYIGDECFSGTHIASDFTIPYGVTYIGTYAFGASGYTGALNQSELIIPDSVTKIGSSAFKQCAIGTFIKISNNLKRIEQSTFELCTRIFANILVEIGNLVEYIGANAFRDSAVGKVHFNNKTSYIGNNAFSGTDMLSELIFKQPKGFAITLPVAGSSTGAFYYKNSRNVIIRTDNETIKNYDWTADNVVPIFYHLDGTAWE
jgi:hypothetical protein